VRVGNIEIDHLDAGLEHRRGIAERLRRQRAEAVGKSRPAERVGDDVAVESFTGPLGEITG
jgi:hypothetical protein